MIPITNGNDFFIAIGTIQKDVKKLYIKLDEDNSEITIGLANFHRKYSISDHHYKLFKNCFQVI